MQPRTLLRRIRKGKVLRVAFEDFVDLLTDLGFERGPFSVSYWIYRHRGVPRPFPVQLDGEFIRPFQIRQLLRLLESCVSPQECAPTADFVHLFWSEEDRCYVADIPELFPCAAYGDTAEEALELLGVVMEAWLDAAEQWEMPLPEEAERRAQVLLGA